MTASFIRLSSLSRSARVMLTAFLLLIACGYLAALANLYHQHESADGRPGLSLDDLRVTFHGMELPVEFGVAASRGGKSRMMQMIEPGGKMRKHLFKGGDAAVRVLTDWLESGAPREKFDKPGIKDAEDPSPSMVIADQCLDCHNADSGERRETPFGPDLFSVSFDMVNVYAEPGSSTGSIASRVTSGPASKNRHPVTRRAGPMSLSHLFHIAHAHLLTIPVFTLIVAIMFLLCDAGPRCKALLGPLPMLALVIDFAMWWMARWFEAGILVMVASGAVFGMGIAGQMLIVLWSMWKGSPDAPAKTGAR